MSLLENFLKIVPFAEKRKGGLPSLFAKRLEINELENLLEDDSHLLGPYLFVQDRLNDDDPLTELEYIHFTGEELAYLEQINSTLGKRLLEMRCFDNLNAHEAETAFNLAKLFRPIQSNALYDIDFTQLSFKVGHLPFNADELAHHINYKLFIEQLNDVKNYDKVLLKIQNTDNPFLNESDKIFMTIMWEQLWKKPNVEKILQIFSEIKTRIHSIQEAHERLSSLAESILRILSVFKEEPFKSTPLIQPLICILPELVLPNVCKSKDEQIIVFSRPKNVQEMNNLKQSLINASTLKQANSHLLFENKGGISVLIYNFRTQRFVERPYIVTPFGCIRATPVELGALSVSMGFMKDEILSQNAYNFLNRLEFDGLRHCDRVFPTPEKASRFVALKQFTMKTSLDLISLRAKCLRAIAGTVHKQDVLEIQKKYLPLSLEGEKKRKNADVTQEPKAKFSKKM